MKAPNNQAILQFSIKRLIDTITNVISIPPKKQIKQNKEKDFNKGFLEPFLKTHDFAKINETMIPTKQPDIDANNIFLKIRYNDTKEIKFKLEAITPDKKNLSICLLFFFKNLYNFKFSNLIYLNTKDILYI